MMQTTEWKRVEPVWNRVLDMVWKSVETAQKSLQQVSANVERSWTELHVFQ